MTKVSPDRKYFLISVRKYFSSH